MSAHFAADHLLTGLVPVFERSRISLSVADVLRDDCPLVGLNDGFCTLSGYAPDEALNRNCRFLQPETGAGPVRSRIRRFIEDPESKDEKFAIPNIRKDGSKFLNLVYLAKLRRAGRTVAILGTQFAAGGADADLKIYERAVSEDLRQLRMAVGENHLALLGSYDALASGISIVAQARLD